MSHITQKIPPSASRSLAESIGRRPQLPILRMKRSEHPEIPAGDYCYVGGEHYYDEQGRYRWRTYTCPHMTTKVVNGVALPWCSLLKAGSVPGAAGSLTDDDREKLIKAWGLSTYGADHAEELVKDGIYETVEEAKAVRTFETPSEFDLFLLWDSCKECGENMDQPGVNMEDHRYLGYVRPSYPNQQVELMVTAEIEGESREFTVWTLICKSGTTGDKVRQLLKFLRRLPAVLEKNCGIKEATLGHRTAKATAPLAGIGSNVAFAHAVIREL